MTKLILRPNENYACYFIIFWRRLYIVYLSAPIGCKMYNIEGKIFVVLTNFLGNSVIFFFLITNNL